RETASRSDRVLFPLYWDCRGKNDGSRTLAVLPFYLDRREPGGQSTTRAITPFYWDWRNPAGAGWSLFPFLWNWRGKTKADVFFPFYWDFRGREEGERTTALLPFYFHRRSAGGASGVRAVTPLFWDWWNPAGAGWTLFPLYWRWRGKTRTDVLFPFYWDRRDDEGRARVLFPFWFENENARRADRVLFPFFWDFLGKKDDSRTTAFPPFYFLHRRPGGTSGVQAFTPFLWNWWSPAGSGWSTLPIYWRWRGKTNADVVFPFYWDFRREDGHTRAVFPFWFENENRRRRDRVLFPLYWDFAEKGDGNRTTALLPFYFRTRTAEGASGFETITPFFWNWWAPKRRGWSLFPLYWGWRGKTRGDVLFPLYWDLRGTEGSTRVLFPLWFENENQTRADRVFFPFLWDFQGKTDGSRTTVVPPFYLSHQEAGGRSGVRAVTPLFWNWWGPKNRGWTLFPLLWSLHGKTRADVLFPFYWNLHEEGRHTNVLFPFWFYESSEERTSFLAPFTYYSRRNGNEDLSLLFPLFHYASRPDADRWRIDLLWPLFSLGQGKGLVHSRLLPLWWHDSDERESLTVVPGLSTWFFRQDDLTSAGLLFPLFKYRRSPERDESQVDLLWPIFSYRTEGDYTHSRLLPLWWHEGDDESSLTLIPPLLGFHRRHSEGGYGSVLFPLTWYSWDQGGDFDFRVLWELVRYSEGKDGRWDFRILHKLFHVGGKGDFFEFELNPFFRFEVRDGCLTHFSLLGGALFSYDYDEARNREEARLFYFLKF
ncbi:MAG: hypothetical protein ACYS47_13420, partial [Planctomycetota bacterium]